MIQNQNLTDLERALGQLREQRRKSSGLFSIYSAGFGQAALDRLDDNDANPYSRGFCFRRWSSPGWTSERLRSTCGRRWHGLPARSAMTSARPFTTKPSGAGVSRGAAGGWAIARKRGWPGSERSG
jgi:hypothetical protein